MAPPDDEGEELAEGVVPALVAPPAVGATAAGVEVEDVAVAEPFVLQEHETVTPAVAEPLVDVEANEDVVASADQDVSAGIVPELMPVPMVVREFRPQPWFRPRKQYVRRFQWNQELIDHVMPARGDEEPVIRVCGLPSMDYLDLLSMRSVCEERECRVSYLGFNSSHRPSKDSPRTAVDAVDLYRELGMRSVMGASSFVHPRSTLVPDRFEQIRHRKSMSRKALDTFVHFDVVNLDICGAVVDVAGGTLEAVAEILNWQSVRRVTPWLFCLTTFASATEIHLPGCRALAAALPENAATCAGFEDSLLRFGGFTSEDVVGFFEDDPTLPPQAAFVRVFAIVVGKWLAAKLRLPNPPALISMLPSYCFRHEDRHEPELLSLAYLVKPALVPGTPGVGIAPVSHDGMADYCRHAEDIVRASSNVVDLDELLEREVATRLQMVDETAELLVHCGFDVADVNAYMERYRVT